jgi:hypothetical protein
LAPGLPRSEAPTVPPVAVWAEVQEASKERAGHRRPALRRRKVAQRERQEPREAARLALVRVRRELAVERVAVWEPKAAQPTGCWRPGWSTAPSAVECPWADRLRQPWRRRRLVHQCQRRLGALTDCLRSPSLGSKSKTAASWGC